MSLRRREKPKLVVFDVEGVIIPKNRYLFDVSRNLGFLQSARTVFYGTLYALGVISLKSAMKYVFKFLEGSKEDDLLQTFRRIPLMPGSKEAFENLRNQGCKTALISSGLPTFIVQDLARTLKADYAYGFEPGAKEGVLTGEIRGDVIEHEGKLPFLTKLLEKEHLTPEECAVVADDRNNASILLPGALKIGYNPDFVVRFNADCIITGNLREVASVINGQTRRNRNPPTKNDVLREIIHACGITMPLLSILVGLYPIALFILSVTSLYIVSELALMEKRNLPIISSITRHAVTAEEDYGFRAAPIFFAFGILLTLLLFPFPASGAAIAAFSLGDSAATIFGKTLGRHTLPFNKGKTLEGSLTGFIAAFLAATVFINPLKALLGATVAMLIESLPLPINDNLAVPIITGLVLTLIR